MAFPQQVLDDIERGKAFLRNLDADSNRYLTIGSCKSGQYYHCLYILLRDLGYKVELDEYDGVVTKLYHEMLLIIGNFIPVATAKAYYSSTPTNTVPTYEEILSWPFISYPVGQPFVIPFLAEDYSFLRFATDATDPEKNYYTDQTNADNKGSMGTEDDLFPASVPIAGATPLKLYTTAYLTIYNPLPRPLNAGFKFETR